MTPALFILIVLCGFGVGIFSGMFGIGGGTLMIPLLNIVFRLPILLSTATSLFVIAPTAISGTWQHVRQGSVDVRAAMTIGLAGAVASTVTALASDRLPELVILVLAFLVIAYSASSIIGSALKDVPSSQEATESAESTESTESTSRFASTRGTLIAFLCLGIFAGAIAGVVGVGGGFVIVPVGIAYFGYSFKQASGTSLLAIALIALPGIVTHAALGHIWYLGGIALMIGTIPGANLGARLIARIPERTARLAFGALLALSAVMLIVNRAL
jgi:uncharacterized membrane protein YfcA